MYYKMAFKRLRNAALGLVSLVCLSSNINADDPEFKPRFNVDGSDSQSLQFSESSLGQGKTQKETETRPKYDVKVPEKEEVKSDWSGLVSTTFMSNYIGVGGFVIGKGPVSQGLLVLNHSNNFVKGDTITASGWFNHDYGDHEWVEVDMGLEYSRPTELMKNLLNYSDPTWTDRMAFGYTNFFYPGRVLGSVENNDDVIYFRWNHSSRIDIAGTWKHVFGDRDVRNGDLLEISASKEKSLEKLFGRDWYVNPMVGVSYDCRFYGEDGFNFFTQVTSGIRKGNCSVEGFIGAQKVLNSTNPLRHDDVYFGVRLIKSF